MKGLPIFIAVVLTLFTYNFSFAQWSSIKGEGPVVTETIDLENFDGVGLGISADVVLTQGDKQEVKITAQKNIIDNIKRKVRGNSWNISFEENARNYKDVTIYITMPRLTSVSIGGSGDIRTTNKFDNLDDVNISIGGSGDVNLDLSAKDVKVSIGGSGKVALEGDGDDLSISIGGSGDVSASNFPVDNCKVSSAGSGDIDVNVEDALNVTLVGSGDVHYKGNPQVKTTIVGSGEVEKM